MTSEFDEGVYREHLTFLSDNVKSLAWYCQGTRLFARDWNDWLTALASKEVDGSLPDMTKSKTKVDRRMLEICQRALAPRSKLKNAIEIATALRYLQSQIYPDETSQHSYAVDDASVSDISGKIDNLRLTVTGEGGHKSALPKWATSLLGTMKERGLYDPSGAGSSDGGALYHSIEEGSISREDAEFQVGIAVSMRENLRK